MTEVVAVLALCDGAVAVTATTCGPSASFIPTEYVQVQAVAGDPTAQVIAFPPMVAVVVAEVSEVVPAMATVSYVATRL